MAGPRFILWHERDRAYVGLVIALGVLLTLLVCVFFVCFTSARIDGDSMAPTLLPEDRVLITRGYDTPRVGDIISADVVTPTGPDSIVKRVIALPGDRVRMIGSDAYVNGELSSAAPDPILARSTLVGDSLVVPEGAVYVLGDNRPVSDDSRFIGPVPIASITGRVVAVFSPVTRFRIID